MGDQSLPTAEDTNKKVLLLLRCNYLAKPLDHSPLCVGRTAGSSSHDTCPVALFGPLETEVLSVLESFVFGTSSILSHPPAHKTPGTTETRNTFGPEGVGKGTVVGPSSEVHP